MSIVRFLDYVGLVQYAWWHSGGNLRLNLREPSFAQIFTDLSADSTDFSPDYLAFKSNIRAKPVVG
jgi:hypothetical protein